MLRIDTRAAHMFVEVFFASYRLSVNANYEKTKWKQSNRQLARAGKMDCGLWKDTKLSGIVFFFLEVILAIHYEKHARVVLVLVL